MICKKCGAGLKDNSKYCEACGSKTEIESPLIMVENEHVGKTNRTKKSKISKAAMSIAFIVVIVIAIIVVSH